LSEKFARDWRSVMTASWHQALFPTRLSNPRANLQELTTTARGFRLATSIGGVLTGRGADLIVIDDPLKPDEAISETERRSVNEWFDGTLYSRLNDKSVGVIVVIMQRLHEDDLVGHLLRQQGWRVLAFPAIAEVDETHVVETLFGRRTYRRRAGEALHPKWESLATLDTIRQTIGTYNFAGQYQQSPAPAGGGMVRAQWFGLFGGTTILIEDKASGTQLVQDLVAEGLSVVRGIKPADDKIHASTRADGDDRKRLRPSADLRAVARGFPPRTDGVSQRPPRRPVIGGLYISQRNIDVPADRIVELSVEDAGPLKRAGWVEIG
jgi:hypothetical protein